MKNDATKKEKRPTRKMPDSVKITHEKYRTRKKRKRRIPTQKEKETADCYNKINDKHKENRVYPKEIEHDL